METPKEILDKKYQETLNKQRDLHHKELEIIQNKCPHPEKDRKKKGGNYWHDWPDYGFTPGIIWCDLCGKTLGECYDNYKGFG